MKIFSARRPAIRYRGIHLDLKGNQPTDARMLELLDLVAGARMNAVLAEWEDTFPWRRYPELRSPTAYAPEFVRRMQDRCEKFGIEIIPLVQCFGHSENILSRKRFRHLREVPDNVAEFCPSNPGSASLVIELVDDVLALMGDRVKRFHLGGDEAWHMGSCPRCRKLVKKIGKDRLYLQHVTPILRYLEWRGVRPILWDDMMRKWPAKALSEMARRSDLMAWSYDAKPVRKGKSFLTETHLANHRSAGVTVWAGSAYKGAEGPFADIPDPATRVPNNGEWAKMCRRYGIKGMIATAWSRYDTFLAPCETIEASLDMLVAAGAAMWDGKLPKDATEQSRRWLSRWKGGREGRRFDRCHGAAAALQEWVKGFQEWSLDGAERAAHLVGEPDRVNPAVVRRNLRNIAGQLRGGRRLGVRFIAAHRGLIPDRWLRLYVESRILPYERRFRNLPKR